MASRLRVEVMSESARAGMQAALDTKRLAGGMGQWVVHIETGRDGRQASRSTPFLLSSSLSTKKLAAFRGGLYCLRIGLERVSSAVVGWTCSGYRLC